MKEGYKIYKYQRDVLIQQKRPDGATYNPIKDINGDYFIFEEEHKYCGLGEKTEFVEPNPEPLL